MVASLLRTASFVALVATCSATDAATVFSEGFSTANQSVSSGYALVPVDTFTAPGQYRVVSNPATDFANGYASYFDHSVGNATGAMLFFDESSASLSIWSTSAMLTAGTQYTFSFFLSSGSTLNPPVLDLFIDGMDTSASVTTAQAGSWQSFAYGFTASISGVHQFSIDDANPDMPPVTMARSTTSH